MKIGEKWDNLGQISHFSQSHFPHFSTTSPTLPQVPLMNFARRTSQLEKWEFRDGRTLANFLARRRWLEVPWHMGNTWTNKAVSHVDGMRPHQSAGSGRAIRPGDDPRGHAAAPSGAHGPGRVGTQDLLGQAGFQLEGGGVDRAPWLDPPPPKGAQLTGPPKSYRDGSPGLGGDPDPTIGKKMKMGFLESAHRGGSGKSSFAMYLVEKNFGHF